jgi:predicted permease
MSWLHVVRYRLRGLFQSNAHRREIDEEIRHHLDLEAMDVRADAGGALADAEIRLRARRRFGNVTYSNEERRLISGIAMIDAARQDITFVLRLLRRRAVFAAVTIVTIALGIGAATSIFSVADGVLFRPLPFPDPDRLTTVWMNRPTWKSNPALIKRWNRGTISLPVYREWRAAQRSFVDIAVWTSATAMVGDLNAAEEVSVGEASASLFSVLGIHPEVGAWFIAADDVGGGAPVAVISHEMWAARYGAALDVVGRLVTINGVGRRIVGVAPRGLSLDRAGTLIAYWIPAGQDSANVNDRGSDPYQAIGRLKGTVTLAAATEESMRLLPKLVTDDRVEGATLASLQADQTRNVRGPLLLLLAAASLLLVIACINVATLLLGESARRQIELRIRTALGATRPRLVRQLLTESLVLAGVGSIAGVGLAYAATRVIVSAAPPETPGLADVHVNGHVLGVALMGAVVTGFLFGLAPAVSLARSSQSLSIGGVKHTSRGHGRGQRALIACEVALSMVLLVGAGLLVRTFSKLSTTGFQPMGLQVVTIRLPRPPYADSMRSRPLYDALIARLTLIPGVVDVAATSMAPFSNGSSSTSYTVEGRPVRTGAPPNIVQRRMTSPEFFRTAGVPMVDGRAYTAADRAGTTPVIVVSRTLARAQWPAESAIGKRINLNGELRTIIGVAADIETERPTADLPETFYAPLSQLMPRGTPRLLLRTRAGADAAEVAATMAAMRKAIRDVDGGVTILRIDKMSDMVSRSLADDRLRTVLITLFAAIAAVLAAVGTYGVAATSAERRTREMAIRVAVGATGASIARLIVGGAAVGVVLGGAVGVGLALAGTRVLSPYLYGVRMTDPVVYGGVGLLLVLTTVAATWVPARRAMRVRVADTLAAE